MKKLFILFLSSFIILFANAQGYNAAKVNKKALQIYNDAIARAQDGNYPAAISLLQKAVEADTKYVDAYLSLAGVYGQLKEYAKSINYYQQAFAIDPQYTNEYKLPYSINLAGLGQFDKALTAVTEFLADPKLKNPTSRKAGEYRQRSFQFAVDFDKKQDGKNYVFAPVNLGDGINTNESEYFPSLAIDGKELIFTRRLRNFNEDFFSSQKKYDTWDIAKALTGNINTDQNEGAQMVSQDGQWLVFTGCNRRDGFGSCDIYISFLTEKGWSEALNLGGNINSDQWDSQPCLSPDKRDLYFSSRRFGGYGGSDIYVSHLKPNGKWSDPENLGPGINTPGDENSPFMHADNQTLYFTSSGLQGYGDEDLFLTRKGPKGAWSVPENLGYPINTISREGTLFITADGETAYYASDRSDTHGGLDIYSFTMRDNIKPHKTLWVKGKVFDKTTTKGLPSAVELIDLSTKETLSKVQTDEKGNYLITLPAGKKYAFNVTRKGYLFYSDTYSLTDKTIDSTYEKNIPLQPIEANASIVLSNIFYDINKFELKDESQVELDKLVDLLKENPTVTIQISGYTDNVGKPADNLTLSNNRAKAVVGYLTGKGINAKRLSFKGYGETNAVADNNTEDGKAKNRRTELKIISK